jgi:hypothetical protein
VIPLSQSAYIKLTEGSKTQVIALKEVKELLEYYIQMTRHTGQQLDWDYDQAAFPYEINEQKEDGNTYLLLKGTDTISYNHLLIGTGIEQGIPFIQIVLPSRATHGDKAKANEYSKFLAKELKGELHLFNQRIIFYNKIKD